MIALFDTNIWVAEEGLSSAMGAAARLYLKINKFSLAVPEVIEQEIKINLHRRVQDYLSKLSENHRRLTAIMGFTKELVVPSASEIEKRINLLIDEIDIQKIKNEFTLDAAKDSFARLLNGHPPSADQQFKDGVVWYHVKQLLEKNDVAFVTSDKNFYQDGEYKQGLSKFLLKEIQESDHKLAIYEKLSDFMSENRLKLELDAGLVSDAYLVAHKDGLLRLLDHDAYTLGGLEGSRLRLFATEDERRVALEFSLTYSATHKDGELPNDGKVEVQGTGVYLVSEGKVKGISVDEECFSRPDEGGEMKSRRSLYMTATSIIGHADKHHKVRSEIK